MTSGQNKTAISFHLCWSMRSIEAKLSSAALKWELKSCGAAREAACSLSGSSTLWNRAEETLMTHVSPSSSPLCFDWLELQRWHAPAASGSLKALILHSKLFNSHIKTCQIWLRPRWRSASLVSMQTLAGDNRCCGEWRLVYSRRLWVFHRTEP